MAPNARIHNGTLAIMSCWMTLHLSGDNNYTSILVSSGLGTAEKNANNNLIEFQSRSTIGGRSSMVIIENHENESEAACGRQSPFILRSCSS